MVDGVNPAEIEVADVADRHHLLPKAAAEGLLVYPLLQPYEQLVAILHPIRGFHTPLELCKRGIGLPATDVLVVVVDTCYLILYFITTAKFLAYRIGLAEQPAGGIARDEYLPVGLVGDDHPASCTRIGDAEEVQQLLLSLQQDGELQDVDVMALATVVCSSRGSIGEQLSPTPRTSAGDALGRCDAALRHFGLVAQQVCQMQVVRLAQRVGSHFDPVSSIAR